MLNLLVLFFVPVALNEVTFANERWRRTMTNYLENNVHSTPRTFPETYYTDLEYDFIIVGAGSSGSVVANRLSEISSWKILLLEAGNPGNFLTTVPLMVSLFPLTPYSWNYTTERQEGCCLAMEDQKCAWPKGRALGGSSVINYMIYARGNPKDYQKWYDMGNDGWSYPDLLPYFKKSEDCRLGKECSNEYHNRGGLWSVEYPFKSRITEAFIEAGVEMGEKIIDYHSEDFIGFSVCQGSLKRGRRHSTADAFLYPFASRTNLKILTSTRVTKILLDDLGNAYGVEFWKRGKKYVARASKEVILSAGALNSPQLLMLSGVGPQEHLHELDIPTIRNLPVGQSLYDHLTFFGLSFKMNETAGLTEAIFDPLQSLKWLSEGKGFFASLGGVEALGLINAGHNSDPNYPDIELLFSAAGSLESDFGLFMAKELRVKRHIYDVVFKPLEAIPTWSILPTLLHPQSRGFVRLRSKNPYDSPLFYANYFSDPEGKDIKTMLAAIRYVQKMSQTRAFQRFGSKMPDIPVPGCEVFAFDSDDYWFCVLRSLSSSAHHQTGTCKMGPKKDPEAVVDERLKVHGIIGLRVIDASIMPATLSAHTSAPCVMIGEKGADMIKHDWGVL